MAHGHGFSEGSLGLGGRHYFVVAHEIDHDGSAGDGSINGGGRLLDEVESDVALAEPRAWVPTDGHHVGPGLTQVLNEATAHKAAGAHHRYWSHGGELPVWGGLIIQDGMRTNARSR
jgi:hypothetical protein